MRKPNFLILFIGFLLILLSQGFDQEYLSKYDGHTVYQVYIHDEDVVTLLNKIELSRGLKFDYWTEGTRVNRWAHIMIRPDEKNLFEELLTMGNVQFSILIENVGDMIRNQVERNENKILAKSSELTDFDYGKYHKLDEINDWMNALEAAYPKFVTVFNVSKSYQNRDIYAMKISIPNASRKPAIWFDGGIHAREWISPATVIYMANAFLSNYTTDPYVKIILDTFDLYVLPVFNVDGYEYTWSKDRMWRKTRSKTKVPGCYGADPNRNWDAHFCAEGASKDPCSDTYCGEHAFSEIEVKGVSDFLLKNKDTIVSYLNFHSYSQLWMSPYGYTTQKPDKFDVQDGGSVAALNALTKLYGTQYEHGNIASTIYIASGSSVDWTFDAAGMVWSYAVELRDQGQYGFLLPPEQILPSGQETYEGLKALALYIMKQVNL